MPKKSVPQSSPVEAATTKLKRERGRPKKGEEPALSHLPLPSTPQASIGLDIGVEGFHVCVPVAGQDARDWPVWFIRYEGNPHWRKQLAAMLDENTICLAEPTGWNYLAPVARVICLQSPAKLYLIEHARTTHVRRTLDIAQKTDVNDARTLAYTAFQLHLIPKFAGCWLFDWATSDALLKLRFLMNAYHKAAADRTRFKNRLNHLGHSIDPALTNGSAWLTAMKWQAFTPKQIAALDTSAMPSATRRAIARLLEYLDTTIDVSDVVLDAIKEAYSSFVWASERCEDLALQLERAVLQSPFAHLYQRLMTYPLASSMGCVAIIIATKGRGDTMSLQAFRSCLGVFPQIKESGKVKKARAQKKGYRPAMKAIHMWAQQLVREAAPDNVVRTYFAGGEKAGGRKFSATKARLVRTLHGVIKNPYGHNDVWKEKPHDDDAGSSACGIGPDGTCQEHGIASGEWSAGVQSGCEQTIRDHQADIGSAHHHAHVPRRSPTRNRDTSD